MKTELYRAIKEIDIKSLTDDDLKELLNFFMITKNDLIRNQIAFIFEDLHYDKAVPFILKKINDKSVFHNNGSLVYALAELDVKKYFIEIVKIICVHEYEARLEAYEIIHKITPSIPDSLKRRALKILKDYKLKLECSASDSGENSTLHFIEKTEELLHASLQ